MRERTRPPTHPGGILKRQYLEPLHLSIAQAADSNGVPAPNLRKAKLRARVTEWYFGTRIEKPTTEEYHDAITGGHH